MPDISICPTYITKQQLSILTNCNIERLYSDFNVLPIDLSTFYRLWAFEAQQCMLSKFGCPITIVNVKYWPKQLPELLKYDNKHHLHKRTIYTHSEIVAAQKLLRL